MTAEDPLVGVEFEGELPDDVDEAAIERMRTVAAVLDESVRLPVVGVRVGVDSVIGLLPISGDLVGGAFSLYVVAEAARLGVSAGTLLRMLLNVAIDVGGGSIPYAGAVFDVFWRANVRNVELAVQDLAEPTAAAGGSLGDEPPEGTTIDVTAGGPDETDDPRE